MVTIFRTVCSFSWGTSIWKLWWFTFPYRFREKKLLRIPGFIFCRECSGKWGSFVGPKLLICQETWYLTTYWVWEWVSWISYRRSVRRMRICHNNLLLWKLGIWDSLRDGFMGLMPRKDFLLLVVHWSNSLLDKMCAETDLVRRRLMLR